MRKAPFKVFTTIRTHSGFSLQFSPTLRTGKGKIKTKEEGGYKRDHNLSFAIFSSLKSQPIVMSTDLPLQPNFSIALFCVGYSAGSLNFVTRL